MYDKLKKVVTIGCLITAVCLTLSIQARLKFQNGALASPQLNSSSAGSRLVLAPKVSASLVDSALGIEGGALWESVPDSTGEFSVYAGVTPSMRLTGSGYLGVGNITPVYPISVMYNGSEPQVVFYAQNNASYGFLKTDSSSNFIIGQTALSSTVLNKADKFLFSIGYEPTRRDIVAINHQKVGIGVTQNLQEALTISGNLKVSGNITANAVIYNGVSAWRAYEINSFRNTADGWSGSSAQILGTDYAYNLYILGGYNLLGGTTLVTKTIALPSSYKDIKIKFKLYILDSWDNETWSLKFQSQLTTTETTLYQEVFNHSNLNGNSAIYGNTMWLSDHIKLMEIILPYSKVGNSLTLKMQATLDSSADDESWGISDFELYIR